MKLTYRQAYDRIVDAYFKNQLVIIDSCRCFVGNLFGGRPEWTGCRISGASLLSRFEYYTIKGTELLSEYGYTERQITDLELCFMSTGATLPDEERFFMAMSATFDMLKKIHEENGEIIDAPVFKKRVLQESY